MIGQTIQHYRIVSQLGEGGMGVVYLAEHLRLPKRVAIKVLSKSLSGDPQFRQRFFGEAQKQAILDHPNIVQATDFFEAEGQFFLVMEYVNGPDVGKLIREKGKLSEQDALPILEDILRGLGFAHGKGLVHRDMKPSNVLIDEDGRARIMDFGIAILAGAAEKRLTATGGTIGSPWYMSPEQIQTPSQLDSRTDIYSVGIVAFEMLSGDVPFTGDTDYSIQSQQISSVPPDLHVMNPAVSKELAEIVHTALAKNPVQRFQSCADFRKRLEAYQRTQTPPVTPPRPVAQWLAAASVVILLAVAIVAFSRRPAPPPEPPREDPKVQHEIAYNLMESASVKASQICRDLKTVDLKRNGLKIAREIDTATSAALERQVDDLEKNITEAVPEYGQLVSRLAALDGAVVEEEAKRYLGTLTKKTSYEQIRMARMAKNHSDRRRTGETTLDVNAIRRGCDNQDV